MTRRSASRSADDLLAEMDDAPQDGVAITASAVNRQTAERMFDVVRRASERLSARFVGGSADRHELTTRAATHALLSVQESVSSIGARLSGHTTGRGQIPKTILAATELRFSPSVLPGSVVFELSRATDAENMIEDQADRPLLDESFDKLFELLSSVGSSSAGPTSIPASVRDLGPRAAKHIFDLCQVLVDEGMGLDFEWMNRNGVPKAAVLTNLGARYLKQVAKESNSETTTQELAGVLLTASVESKQKLKLRTQDGTIVSMAASDEIRADLARFYNKGVRVGVETTESVNLTTGKATASNRLMTIRSADPESIESAPS